MLVDKIYLGHINVNIFQATVIESRVPLKKKKDFVYNLNIFLFYS